MPAGGSDMMRKASISVVVLVFAAIIVSVFSWRGRAAEAGKIAIDADDIGGTVTGAHGPEAGDLPTKYAKIVVTDDAGRYVLPDLPQANYSIWVRGYGLVDSPKTQAR